MDVDFTQAISILLSAGTFSGVIITLFRFHKERKNEHEDRGRRQAQLDATLSNIEKSIAGLTKGLESHQALISTMQTTLQLLIQQHHMNHGQTVHGGIGKWDS